MPHHSNFRCSAEEGRSPIVYAPQDSRQLRLNMLTCNNTTNALHSMTVLSLHRNQSRCNMSANESATCSRCTNILLEDLNFYALGNLGSMNSSGCPGCRFFVNVALRYRCNISDESGTQMLMRRTSKDVNLVDVYYVRNDNGDTSITMAHKLRLCATFGMQLSQTLSA